MKKENKGAIKKPPLVISLESIFQACNLDLTQKKSPVFKGKKKPRISPGLGTQFHKTLCKSRIECADLYEFI